MLTKLNFDITERDLNFIIKEATLDNTDKKKIKKSLDEDRVTRDKIIGSQLLFEKIITSPEPMFEISPRLFFEIILRKTKKEFEKSGWTVEKVGQSKIPVFDKYKMASFVSDESILEYLSNMLCTFTRTESFTIPIRVRKGIWRKIRFSDMDIDSLIRLSSITEEANRFYYYKRIADLGIFILGVFPEYIAQGYRYPHSKNLRPKLAGRIRRSEDEYRKEAKRYYSLAAVQNNSYITGLSSVLSKMENNIGLAVKILDFITQHYLHITKYNFFEI
jgi:hypothetical protein